MAIVIIDPVFALMPNGEETVTRDRLRLCQMHLNIQARNQAQINATRKRPIAPPLQPRDIIMDRDYMGSAKNRNVGVHYFQSRGNRMGWNISYQGYVPPAWPPLVEIPLRASGRHKTNAGKNLIYFQKGIAIYTSRI